MPTLCLRIGNKQLENTKFIEDFISTISQLHALEEIAFIDFCLSSTIMQGINFASYDSLKTELEKKQFMFSKVTHMKTLSECFSTVYTYILESLGSHHHVQVVVFLEGGDYVLGDGIFDSIPMSPTKFHVVCMGAFKEDLLKTLEEVSSCNSGMFVKVGTNELENEESMKYSLEGIIVENYKKFTGWILLGHLRSKVGIFPDPHLSGLWDTGRSLPCVLPILGFLSEKIMSGVPCLASFNVFSEHQEQEGVSFFFLFLNRLLNKNVVGIVHLQGNNFGFFKGVSEGGLGGEKAKVGLMLAVIDHSQKIPWMRCTIKELVKRPRKEPIRRDRDCTSLLISEKRAEQFLDDDMRSKVFRQMFKMLAKELKRQDPGGSNLSLVISLCERLRELRFIYMNESIIDTLVVFLETRSRKVTAIVKGFIERIVSSLKNKPKVHLTDKLIAEPKRAPNPSSSSAEMDVPPQPKKRKIENKVVIKIKKPKSEMAMVEKIFENVNPQY